MTRVPRARRLRDRLRSDRVLLPLTFLGFVAVRWPLRSHFLVNWDAVNFALGVHGFDLVHHQPHPPGYLGYVLLGRAATWLVGDPNTGLVVLSVIAGAALPVGVLLLARRMMARRWALVVALLVGTSPIVWYYSVVALTYIVSASAVAFLAWAAHVARHDRSERHLYLAALLVAAVGAIRPTDLLFVLPLAWWAARPFSRRRRLVATGLLGAATALWLLPLLALSGGIGEYLALSRSLAELAGGRTWILGLNPLGLAQNVGLVAAGCVLGLNVALLAYPWALIRRVSVAGLLRPSDRDMVLLWTVPCLIVFLLVHTGQMGYVLLFLPAMFLPTGRLLERLDKSPSRRPGAAAAVRGRSFSRRVAVTGILAVNVVGFFAYPSVARDVIVGTPDPAVAGGGAFDAGYVADRTRQYDIAANDQYWQDLTGLLNRWDADSAVVLAVPESGGTFRHLAYYEPDLCVYGIGRDRYGEVGHLFTAHDETSDYAVSGLDRVRVLLPLPAGVRTVLVPDRTIREGLDHAFNVRRGSAVVSVMHVDDGATLVFSRQGDLIRTDVAGPVGGRIGTTTCDRSRP